MLKRSHRYHRYRAVTQAGTFVVLFAIPLLGWARFDAFFGEHRALDGPWIALFNALSGIFFFAAVVYGQRAHRDMDPLRALLSRPCKR